MIEFRAKQAADVPVLHAIWVASVRATHGFLSDADFDEISDLVRDQYLPVADLLVGEVCGRPVGFMGMSGLNIDSLFLDPAVTGSGYGRAFLAQARKKGGPLTLDVNEQNASAHAF